MNSVKKFQIIASSTELNDLAFVFIKRLKESGHSPSDILCDDDEQSVAIVSDIALQITKDAYIPSSNAKQIILLAKEKANLA